MSKVCNNTLTDRQTELSNCNFVKTILMILVVFYHCILFWSGTWFAGNPVFSSEVLNQFAKWFGSFHIYSFTFVSGYLFYYLKYEQGKYQQLIPFVFNKLKRLLVPYIFVAITWVIPIQYLFFKNSFTTLFSKYIIAIAPSQLWFLFMLFNVFVIFWIFSNFFKKYIIRGAVTVIGFYGLGIIASVILPNIFQVWTACVYLPFFWLGFITRQHGSNLIKKIPIALWVTIDVALFIFVQYLLKFDTIVFKFFSLGFTFVLHIIGALMAFVTLQKIAEKVKWNNKYFHFLSKRSMTIYLFHQQIIYFFIYLFNGAINPYINATINFIGAMIISLFISSLLLKFKYTRFLIGEKW